MNDPDGQVLVADVDDAERVIDARFGVHFFDLFGGDVGGSLGRLRERRHLRQNGRGRYDSQHLLVHSLSPRNARRTIRPRRLIARKFLPRIAAVALLFDPRSN